MTLDSTLNGQQLELENTTNYAAQSQPNQKQVEPGLTYIKDLEPNRQGDLAEYIVGIAAVKRGCQVLKNICCTGSIDLSFVHEDREPKQINVDVKSMRSNGKGSYGAAGSACSAKEVVVMVNPFTEHIRWIKGKEPSGWEDFWN